MRDVHRPPTLTLRSRTGAAKPTLWPTLNPCHFTVPCFIFKTKTFSFSSKQALSNNAFGVKIGRTTTLRRLFKVINFRRSKFVCTLWPCPVFGMRAAGLATHLTTPVCPVARTQTIILQVVYCNKPHSYECMHCTTCMYMLIPKQCDLLAGSEQTRVIMRDQYCCFAAKKGGISTCFVLDAAQAPQQLLTWVLSQHLHVPNKMP